jgi:hypothetical protein
MSASTVTFTEIPAKRDVSERRVYYVGTLVVGAGDYATPGLTASLAGIVKSAQLPDRVEVWSDTSGLIYTFVIGTTLANGKLRVWDGGSEVADGATPGGVTGDTIYWKATCHKT